VDVCPVVVPNEYDEGLTIRKAIYLPNPIAVPHSYVLDIFDASQKAVYGFGRYENVITALDLERMIVYAAQGKPLKNLGKRISFIQCVGSRDEQVGNENCSRVCCMYATKLASLLKHSNPERDIYVFYTDLRAYGKGFEEYYKRAQNIGVKFIRGRVAEVIEDSRTKKLTLKVEDTLTRQIIESEFDTVVLSVGLLKAAP